MTFNAVIQFFLFVIECLKSLHCLMKVFSLIMLCGRLMKDLFIDFDLSLMENICVFLFREIFCKTRWRRKIPFWPRMENKGIAI